MTNGRARLGLAVVLLSLPACVGPIEPRGRLDARGDDGAVEITDAGFDLDAPGSDAAFDDTGLDATFPRDAFSMDAFSTVDATWGGCMLGGVMGDVHVGVDLPRGQHAGDGPQPRTRGHPVLPPLG